MYRVVEELKTFNQQEEAKEDRGAYLDLQNIVDQVEQLLSSGFPTLSFVVWLNFSHTVLGEEFLSVMNFILLF